MSPFGCTITFSGLMRDADERHEFQPLNDQFTQSAPVHQFHRDVDAIVLADFVHRRDGGVFQRAAGPRFLKNPSPSCDVRCDGFGQHLQGDPPLQALVVRTVRYTTPMPPRPRSRSSR
jgi:hypothetical protein